MALIYTRITRPAPLKQERPSPPSLPDFLGFASLFRQQPTPGLLNPNFLQSARVSDLP